MPPSLSRRGSEELVEAVERVFAELDDAQRNRAVILATGYAPAGAIELLGDGSLPRVYFVHNNGYLWGPPPTDPDILIAVGFEPEPLTPLFETVEVVARAPCKYCMGWRQDMPIVVASAPRRSLREAWPELRSFGGSLRERYLLRQAGLI